MREAGHDFNITPVRFLLINNRSEIIIIIKIDMGYGWLFGYQTSCGGLSQTLLKNYYFEVYISIFLYFTGEGR